MKKTNFFRHFVETLPATSLLGMLLGMLLLVPLGAGAQVTIGSDKVPEGFSVLELVSHQTQGMRLPQLTTAERDAVQATFGALATTEAEGLTIFNTDTKCVETWNGTQWIALCDACEEPCICEMPPIPVFAETNLGADHTLNTPKKQMAFLATAPASTGTNNGRVYGGRFQWGRQTVRYAISTDGNYTLYEGDSHSGAKLPTATYGDSSHSFGQISTIDGSTPAGDLHVYDNNGSSDGGEGDGIYDWRQTPNSPTYAANGQRDDLWGNGVGPATETGSLFPANPGILACDGKYYQSTEYALGRLPTDTNDPCNSFLEGGWRVPTQDEWERIGAYGCGRPDLDESKFDTASGVEGTVPNASSPFTWVPVVCAGGICTASDAWAAGSNSGYAVYWTADWTAFSDKTGNLAAAAAPEPFLFLPAAGYRSERSGAVAGVGTGGYYWSNTVADAPSVFACAWSFNRTGINSTYHARSRSYGYSVRCVRDPKFCCYIDE